MGVASHRSFPGGILVFFGCCCDHFLDTATGDHFHTLDDLIITLEIRPEGSELYSNVQLIWGSLSFLIWKFRFELLECRLGSSKSTTNKRCVTHSQHETNRSWWSLMEAKSGKLRVPHVRSLKNCRFDAVKGWISSEIYSYSNMASDRVVKLWDINGTRYVFWKNILCRVGLQKVFCSWYAESFEKNRESG